MIKVDSNALIINNSFQDNISSNRGTIFEVSGMESKLFVANCSFFRNTADMGGVAFLGKNSSAKFDDCLFE